MKRNWNASLWIGFGVVLLGVFTYLPLFAKYQATNDIPWVNLLLFLLGGTLLGLGLKRAFVEPQRYRGKVTGVILSVLTLGFVTLFCWGVFVFAKSVPSATQAIQVGQRAPDFVLPDAEGGQVALSEVLKRNRGALLVFYRGYW